MPEEASSSWPVVEVDHRALPESAAMRLLGVLVDHDLHRPDMFELRFQEDPDGDVLGEARIQLGSKVAISAHGLGQKAVERLIEGEVVAIEADYADLVGRTVVRGYDPSHRLHRGQRAITYRNAKISDVARTIARRAGLAVGTIDDSGSVLEVISQFGVSDWEFLSGHARELDFELSVIDGRFHFRRFAKAASAPPEGSERSSNPRQLIFGDDLIEFRPRLSAGQQVEQVQVRAWDPARKKVMIGSAHAGADHAQLQTGPATLTGAMRGHSALAHDHPLGSQSDVDAAARSIAERIGSTFVEADGVALGTPALRAGVTVSVARVARRFAGRYTLTRTIHVFDEDGYRTRFAVSGRQERSLLGLASNGTAGRRAPISGTIVAQVTDNDDPKKLGRVKVCFPTLSDSYVSDWARVVQIGAGPKSGASFLPEVHDEVLCAFELGDIRRPYVLGGLHNGKDTPLLGDGMVDAGRVTRRGFVSRKGHKVILFDGDSASGIALLSADGKLRVSLNQTKGQIHIHSQGPVVIDTDSGAISIKGGGDVALEATGSLSLKGNAGVRIESSAAVEVKGGVVKLN